jgi:hypothetical protein
VSDSPPAQDINYALSTRRLYWFTAVIAVIGSTWCWMRWNWPVSGGFLFGSLASFGNLWIWDSIAASLSGDSNRRTTTATAVFAGRFLALFAFGYVIVKSWHLQPLAAILGLLASSAAVVIEILIELAGYWRLSR